MRKAISVVQHKPGNMSPQMGLQVIHHSNGKASLSAKWLPVLYLCSSISVVASNPFTYVSMLHHLLTVSYTHLSNPKQFTKSEGEETVIFFFGFFKWLLGKVVRLWELFCRGIQGSVWVCILHQIHWPTNREVEQMSWLCSTLIGHSLRLYPHFNSYKEEQSYAFRSTCDC